MKSRILLPLFVCLLSAVRGADLVPSVPAIVQLKAIQSEFETAEKAFEADERATAWADFDQKQAQLFLAAVDLARTEPASETEFAALEWVLTNPRAYYLPVGKPAMELATRHLATDPRVGRIVTSIGFYSPGKSEATYEPAIALIRAVAKTNPDRIARGQALMALALQTKAQIDGSGPSNDSGTDPLVAEAERQFELLAKDYADCPWLIHDNQQTLGLEARQNLFELRHLRLGQVAPEIDGTDLAGMPLRLSGSRGKITVLVFWATWCGPCMEMIPQERTLVARMKGRPFELIGVNGDRDRNEAKRIGTNEGMTWRSFWNGKNGPDGPISHAWNIHIWPSVYVLDARGAIRAKGVRADDLDRTVDRLVKELADEKPR